jgi:hypothetical protein
VAADPPLVPIRRPAFRLVHDVKPEDDLHFEVKEALDRLLLPPAMWTTFPAGNIKLPPRDAAKLYRLGLKRGWPDIFVLYDRTYGIELKRQDGRLSKTRLVRTRRGGLRQLDGQEDVFPRLEAAGMRIAICRSWSEVQTALAGWGVPLRRTS